MGRSRGMPLAARKRQNNAGPTPVPGAPRLSGGPLAIGRAQFFFGTVRAVTESVSTTNNQRSGTMIGELELKTLMLASCDCDVVSYRKLLDLLSPRLRAYYSGKLARTGRGVAEAEGSGAGRVAGHSPQAPHLRCGAAAHRRLLMAALCFGASGALAGSGQGDGIDWSQKCILHRRR